jgi:deazaflavin-dependent oxidoreductase (nitroreductase family)
VSDYNRGIIEEFRASAGKVGGRYEGSTLLLLTTTGARSGRHHTTPLVYLADGERFVVFGTKGGAPRNPDWYHNLLANPVVTVEVGAETFEARATIAAGEERDRLFARQKALRPQFAEYEAKMTRTIPVVVLERK